MSEAFPDENSAIRREPGPGASDARPAPGCAAAAGVVTRATRRWRTALAVGLVAGCLSGAADAQDAIPESLTGTKGYPARGRAIVVNRQVGLCLLCHSGPFPEERFQGDLAPNLGGVGRRLSEGQLRLRIVDSSRVIPTTIMPSYHRTEGLTRVAPAFRGKPLLSAAQIEDVVAFLQTLRD